MIMSASYDTYLYLWHHLLSLTHNQISVVCTRWRDYNGYINPHELWGVCALYACFVGNIMQHYIADRNVTGGHRLGTVSILRASFQVWGYSLKSHEAVLLFNGNSYAWVFYDWNTFHIRASYSNSFCSYILWALTCSKFPLSDVVWKN